LSQRVGHENQTKDQFTQIIDEIIPESALISCDRSIRQEIGAIATGEENFEPS